jgi:hypothetical protein
MKDREIAINKGHIEKKIIISNEIITFSNLEDSINHKYNISTIALAGNGNFPPPFLKGSKVLRDIRSSSKRELNNWKKVLPLNQENTDFFKFDFEFSDQFNSGINTENWGVWICENSSSDPFPDIFLINFPLWIIGKKFENKTFSRADYSAILSQTYRILLSGISAASIFKLGGNEKKLNECIAFSDIGNNLIDKNLYSKIDQGEIQVQDSEIRVRVFTQVLSEWLLKSEQFEKVIIAYGGGIEKDEIGRIWDSQVLESRDEIAEFGDALKLRVSNVKLLKDLKLNTNRKYLTSVLESAIATFELPTPSLSADLMQSRTLAEAISLELCDKFELRAKEANLFAYLERLSVCKNISPWVTSYLHVIRQLGNEAAHYKTEIQRRPEKPVGKDLVVIHAALNRVLSFCIEENL